MFTTIDGVYQDGQVKLSKLPETVSNQAQVLVTFLEPGNLSSEQIRSLIERLETVAGIQEGLDELDSGQTRSITDFAQEMQQKYDISS
ncbi:MAG: hypothetical protein AAGD25_10955 [Cyanobacteria bacterium P01_F01_bin.150]